jgi:hypothetical protein
LSAAAHLETTVAVRGLRPLAADPPHATNELLAAAARPARRRPWGLLNRRNRAGRDREGSRGALEVEMDRPPEREEEGRPWRLSALRWRRRNPVAALRSGIAYGLR